MRLTRQQVSLMNITMIRGRLNIHLLMMEPVSAELNGIKGDFGFAPFYNLVNDLRVKYVYPGSPADLAGIKRGYQITSINGNSSLSYDGPGYGRNQHQPQFCY